MEAKEKHYDLTYDIVLFGKLKAFLVVALNSYRRQTKSRVALYQMLIILIVNLHSPK